MSLLSTPKDYEERHEKRTVFLSHLFGSPVEGRASARSKLDSWSQPAALQHYFPGRSRVTVTDTNSTSGKMNLRSSIVILRISKISSK